MKFSFIFSTLASIALFSIQNVYASFEGDGTFYGNGGNGHFGACMLEPGFNNIGLTVAINREQFQDGMVCGKCVRIVGQGKGLGMTPILGPLYATIDNECSECHYGDIDIGMDGDGRWKIQWDFIDCKSIMTKTLPSNTTVPPNPTL